jgi:ferritin
MKTNRLSDKLTAALNEQMTKKHMLPKYTYPMVHGQITMDSAALQIFFSVMLQRNEIHDENAGIHIKQRCKAIVTAIPAPTTDPVTVNDCFEKYLSMKWIIQNPFIKW